VTLTSRFLVCAFAESAAIPAAVHADIYRYVDENGTVHFTNIPNDTRFKLYTTTRKYPDAVTNLLTSRVVRSQNGDHEAFESLIKDYQRMIHSLCFRMTGSAADAEDLAQETFLQAFQHLAGFRAESRFSSWLYRIAMNQCLNWRKHQSRQDQLYKQWSDQPREAASPDHPNSQLIQDALTKLHPKQRAAVLLTTYDGLSHAEAAQVLGCSETTVSWRLFAARGKLKRWLKDVKSSGPSQ
jgi:RNA polymerase sigma-70 factor (ECF subfamily)